MTSINRSSRLKLLTALLILIASPVTAETRLEGRGSGFVDVKPDQVNFSASVTEVDRDALEAQNRVNRTMANLQTAIAKFNPDENSIDSSILSLNPEYQWDGDRRAQKFVGYRVTRSLAFTTANLSEIGAIMNTLTETGATQIGVPRLSYSKSNDAKAEALRNAVVNARRVVEAMASAVSMSIQTINSISETSDYSTAPFESFLRTESASAVDSTPTVSVGTLRYTANVAVVATAK